MTGALSRDRNLASPENGAAGLGAVTRRRAGGIMLALGSHDLAQLLFHHQSHDLEADSDGERQQSFPDGADELVQREFDLLRQRERGLLVLLDDARYV